MKGTGYFCVALAALLVGCGGSSSGGGGVTFARPAVQASGLNPGQTVSVSLNGGQVITFTSDGRQAFSEQLANGDRYNLAITATSGGADCRFSNGQLTISRTTVTQDTPLTCGEPDPGDPTDPTDPTDPVTPTDPDGGTGELRLLMAAGAEPSMVSMAIRVVRDSGPYTGPMSASDLRVLRDGLDVAGGGEEHLHLESDPEKQRVIITHTDASESMRLHIPAIQNALLDLRAYTQGDFDHRHYFAVFDKGPETRYIYPAANDLTADAYLNGVLRYYLPPGGAYEPGSDLNSAIMNAASSSGDTVSPVHYQTRDAVVITDGQHMAGSLDVQALQQRLVGRRVTLVGYGPDADMAALRLIDPNAVHVSSEAGLIGVLRGLADAQNQRVQGIRLVHHVVAETQRADSETYSLELLGGLCTTTTADCSASATVSGAVGTNRGTLVKAGNRAPFKGELTKIKALRWVDNWLGESCPGTGEYVWAIRTGEDEFTPITEVADFEVYDADGNLEHEGTAEERHVFARTPQSEYLLMRPGRQGNVELYVSEGGQFLLPGCRSSVTINAQKADPFQG
ncbi:VWA domain-containing protein [Alcanivorax sp. JB21]|uniref:vWA domain-containing protein n=1 Tax=Alcanivorax limicola TaxID=2874102 RepID=UPI001CBEF557|nr:vWA domain-containing protein [Alcanivorax limicola]MBZ2189091.1 VWA domain-containing protein [Alcanivorax limicola]